MSKKLMLALLPALLLALPAHAGFEWVPPSGGSQPADSYRTAPIQSPNGFEANMVPMPEKQSLAPAMAAPVPAPVTTTTTQTVQWNDAPPMAITAPAPQTAPAAPKNPDIIEGFGRDVPLSIATRQMVPSSYVVQYGQNVDPNMSVTWSGGRLWKDALIDSLDEKNLKATIVGDTVLIESATPAPVVAVAAAPAPEPAALPPVAEVTIPSAADATQTALATPSTAMPSPLIPMTMNDAAPSPLMPAPSMWVAPRASTLRQVLTDWCREANVQLQWSAQYDYPLMSDVQIGGTFENAVETLLSGLIDAQPRPIARLHPNEPTGPAILVVETRYILE